MTDVIVIEEKEVTLARLSVELERATMDHKAEKDASLYITEDEMFPIWISLRERPKFILLNTYQDMVTGTSQEKLHDICTQINDTYFMPTVCLRQVQRDGGEITRMMAAHSVYYKDGLILSQFIRICRFFSHSMHRIQTEMDPCHEVLLPPGTNAQPQ